MAVRYGWITVNPMDQVVKPRARRPQPHPPTSEEAARLVAAAFDQDDEWGVLVWLVMVTGMRRSELAALRWRYVDLERGVLELRAGYVVVGGVGVHKDTKTHQMRRITLDGETIALLIEHRADCAAILVEGDDELAGNDFVFSGLGQRSVPPSRPSKRPTLTSSPAYSVHDLDIRRGAAREVLAASDRTSPARTS